MLLLGESLVELFHCTKKKFLVKSIHFEKQKLMGRKRSSAEKCEKQIMGMKTKQRGSL